MCASVDCGNVNFARRTSCNRCGVARPRAIGVGNVTLGKDIAASSNGLFSAEDWQCAKCGNVNWKKRSNCNMCGNPREMEIEVRCARDFWQGMGAHPRGGKCGLLTVYARAGVPGGAVGRRGSNGCVV